MSNYFGNVMPNNLVSAANDIFGAAAVAVAAAAMSSNNQQQSHNTHQPIHHHHHDPNRVLQPNNQINQNENMNMINLQPNSQPHGQLQPNGFDDQNFNRFMYDRMPSLNTNLKNTNTNTSTPNSYAQIAGFPHLTSPIHQQNHLNTNPLIGINNPSSGSSSSSSSQFASMSSSSSPDYLNSYKQLESNLNGLNQPAHMSHQAHMNSQSNQAVHHLGNSQHLNQINNQGHLQSPQGHLMSPHQAAFTASLQQQMPQMNQMNAQNLIYPWMRPAGNIKTSKFSGFDHKRTRQTYSRHQTLELEKEFHFNK